MRVYLEAGKTWTFACAVDWPGWCRRGKGEETAIDTLLAYADRYAPAAGSGFDVGEVTVVGRTSGSPNTDFGALANPGAWDDEPISAAERERQLAILERAWSCFDEVARTAPPELRKGPRGGGRDRDKVVDHVREAERAYASKAGVRVPPRTPWPKQRATLLGALRDDSVERKWPVRYAIRRITWHVLDHVWEIEDRS